MKVETGIFLFLWLAGTAMFAGSLIGDSAEAETNADIETFIVEGRPLECVSPGVRMLSCNWEKYNEKI